MHYTDLSGTVRSFNYGTTVSSYLLPNGQPGTRQLANTNYGICVEMVAGYCGIQWSQSSDIYSFTVSGDTSTAVGQGIIGTPASFASGADCTTDFIVVPNPLVNGVPTRTDRFCGNGLPTLTSKRTSSAFIYMYIINEYFISSLFEAVRFNNCDKWR